MFDKQTLYNYSTLVLKFGVNLQKGQGLEIACPVDCADVARTLKKRAYELGASIVRIRWDDDISKKIDYEFADTNALLDIPKWFVDSKNDLVKRDFCYIAVDAEDPFLFKGISAQKLAVVAQKRAKLLKEFSNNVMKNQIRWCVASVPTSAWAKQVFPQSQDAEKELTTAIENCMRLNLPDPEKAWQEHIDRLNSRAEFLNKMNFSHLHFVSKHGTDFTVGLADNHEWLSARERAQDGVYFVANMPTEEVFTAPHRLKAEGIVKSALPLSYNGQIVDNFSLTFKKGKVVDFSAQVGYETLAHLLETDSGITRLGEVALIGKSSPIAQSKILFYNTLFDENASCHLALGKAYPTTIKNGGEMSKDQLKKLGANYSVEHVDFMIGTDDLTVTGITYDNKKTVLFKDGDWII